MDDYFNYSMLLHITRSREDCLTFCVLNGLIPRYRTCHEGKHMVEWSKIQPEDERTAVNRHFKCSKHPNSNLDKVTAAKNTWFERHKIPMEDVLKITYFFTRKFSYGECMHEMRTGIIRSDGTIQEIIRDDLDRSTIEDIYSLCREVLMNGLDHIFEGDHKFGGVGKSVEIDHIKFDNMKHNGSRTVGESWMFAIICEETKDIRLGFITEIDLQRTKDAIRAFIEKHVEPGTTIKSGVCTFYNSIGSWGPPEGPKYTHLEVDYRCKVSRGSDWDKIQSRFSSGEIRSTLSYDLCETLWRKMCLKRRLDPFLNLLEIIKNLYPGEG